MRFKELSDEQWEFIEPPATAPANTGGLTRFDDESYKDRGAVERFFA